ncbi:MAG: hypothetical protein QOI12_3733 [Alphaproteobacteria bacterium]|jgi:hypothetical protein|nr:hypothetical protein [Alphaproteobacteria bacterium]
MTIDETPPGTPPPDGGPSYGRKRPGPTIELTATDLAEKPPRRWLRLFALTVLMIAAGAAGATAVVSNSQRQNRDSVRDIFQVLARLDRQLHEVANRPPSTGIDPRIVDDLTSRFGKLEAAVAAARAPGNDPAAANRISKLEGELQALGDRIGLLARRSDEIAGIADDARRRAETTAAALAELARKVNQPGPPMAERGDVEALAQRLASLEQAAQALDAELARRLSMATGDRPARLAVTAAALNVAVERGEPFTAQLAAVKSFGADPGPLAPLEPFARAGVPSAAVLARELMALLPAMAQAAGSAPHDGGIMERLQANAGKIVRVRPPGEMSGDDLSAILARIEARAAQSDIAGALAELDKLPPQARAPAQAWIAKVEARNAAIDASRRAAADLLAALGNAP